MTELFTSPSYVKLTGDSKQQAFSALLTSSAAELAVRPITDFKDIGLLSTAKLTGKLSITYPAAYQICNVLGAGCYAYITDVMSPDKAFCSSEDYQQYLATAKDHCIRMYNNMAKFAMADLKAHKLVYSSNALTADGLIGSRFVMVYNYRVFDAAIELGTNMPGRMAFHLGELQGRDMTALFVNKVPFVSNNDIRMYRGLLVQNRETGGRAIRLANAIFDSISGSYSVDDFHKDTRIIHASPGRVMSKMLELSDSVIRHQRSITDVTNAVKTAAGKQLADKAGGISEAKIAGIKRRLRAMNVPMRCVNSIGGLLSSASKMRALDLYTLLIVESEKWQRTPAGLALRQAAYKILLGSSTNG